jgi:hypothetical protein
MQTDRIGRPAPRLGLACLAALSLAVGCSSARYLYRPEENATARIDGRPAAYYRIPAQSPHGDVRVAVLGISRLEPQGRDGRESWDESSDGHIQAMHVRLIVDNNDDTAPWQVDTREQIGNLDHYGRSRPAFAALSAGQPPVATIHPGTSETLDLYYPLPASMQKASEIPHFEVLWRVQTAEAPVSERTTFERLRIEAAAAPESYACGMGWMGPGWYDPYWPNYAFWGAPGVTYGRPPAYAPPPAVRTRR